MYWKTEGQILKLFVFKPHLNPPVTAIHVVLPDKIKKQNVADSVYPDSHEYVSLLTASFTVVAKKPRQFETIRRFGESEL